VAARTAARSSKRRRMTASLTNGAHHPRYTASQATVPAALVGR
jgi:hypothetical protein